MKKSLKAILTAFPQPYTILGGSTLQDTCSIPDERLDNCIVEHLAFDSRAVKSGSLFFALPGTHTTGNAFIKDEIQNGAVAVVFEGAFSVAEKNAIDAMIHQEKKKGGRDIFFVCVESARFAMSPISAFFFDNPSEKMLIYGVTGTEGKSSTVSFLWQFLCMAGIKAGFISTVQFSLGEGAKENPEHQTTPEAPIIQERLYQMHKNGCTHAVIEASSHGLSKALNRLGDVHFDVAIFLNVTLEHLEFHKTLEQYRFDKANLFRALDAFDHKKVLRSNNAAVPTEIPSFGIINLEDEAASYVASCTQKSLFGIATENAPEQTFFLSPTFFANHIKDNNTLSFDLTTPDGTTTNIETSVRGAFNAYNIQAALLAVYKTTDIPLKTLLSFPKRLTAVKGRMTAIPTGQDFELIVDYAHTPSSFKAIFPPLKARCTGRIICVFGSGGERDKTKRPLQGEIAAQYSSIIILTDEDPRKEDSLTILKEIAGNNERGAIKMGKVLEKDLFLIPNRPQAIRRAISLAQKGDIVLLLGKSHENSIIYQDGPVPYDEIAEAQNALAERARIDRT